MSKEVSKGLHRLANGRNDWNTLDPDEMNILQKIAKYTKGVVTAANAVTIMGTVAVMNGLFDYINGNKAEGLAKVAGGRLADLGDGYIADRTGTKGRVGRDLDAGVDFVQLGFALPMLVESGTLPWVPAVAVAVPKFVDAGATISAKLRRKEINTTFEGKRSISMIWTGIGALMLNQVAEKHLPGFTDTALDVIGWGGIVVGAVYHIPATAEYASIGFGSAISSKSVEPTANIQQ